MLFSEREGFTKPKPVQKETMDDDLKNSLWNCLDLKYWTASTAYPLKELDSIRDIVVGLWMDVLKESTTGIDNMPWREVLKRLQEWWLFVDVLKIYDVVDYVARMDNDEGRSKDFQALCSRILKRENSAYRFVSGRLSPVTNEIEIKEINMAASRPLDGVRTHLDTAQGLFSDRTKPDYRNSIKESISAIERLCKVIYHEYKADLRKDLRTI